MSMSYWREESSFEWKAQWGDR